MEKNCSYNNSLSLVVDNKLVSRFECGLTGRKDWPEPFKAAELNYEESLVLPMAVSSSATGGILRWRKPIWEHLIFVTNVSIPLDFACFLRW